MLSEAAVSLVKGLQAAQVNGTKVGMRGLYKATKDEDVQRGLGFIIEVAKVFGSHLAPPTRPTTAETTRHSTDRNERTEQWQHSSGSKQVHAAATRSRCSKPKNPPSSTCSPTSASSCSGTRRSGPSSARPCRRSSAICVSGAKPLDIFVVEGTVVQGPNGTGRMDMFAGRPMTEWITDLTSVASIVVGVGDCAAYGGLPTVAAEPE